MAKSNGEELGGLDKKKELLIELKEKWARIIKRWKRNFKTENGRSADKNDIRREIKDWGTAFSRVSKALKAMS